MDSLSLSDRIFLGEALFETIKVTNSIPLNAKAHWQRLKKSAAFLCIPFNLSNDDWYQALISDIKKNKIIDGGMKVILSAGESPRGLSELSQYPWMKIACFSHQPNINPLRLISSSWQRDAKNPIYQHKTVNYLEAVLASRLAKENKADDVLFFNFDRFAQETTVANIFIIKNNQLITPALENGILAGITRQRLIRLCLKHNLNCQEANLTKDDILKADALFTTNSLQGIRVVSSLDAIGFLTEHPLLDRLNHLLLC